ncbi:MULTISPECIES: Hpt domain-containing protein [unclassified Clostridioides]|uniref:Hpt domain-containing protein n=1 Tax=unclassified Clostridioides TaxID=2635829 RepID=UPI001D0FAA02|nr:Hpt domain-containing protein [Clostridioides sp. ES-S-0049-03]MCC0676438.1 Hpt domain-containing protein [Clostridioides sp. ES-W-0018-02]MCC0711361.1 Hpt domain-containing protein [Clostridioides sp. ES-W-0017-02]UDN61336.1 Hpt domain-containing protein [Clostridioides sp. ES-W-0016-02]
MIMSMFIDKLSTYGVNIEKVMERFVNDENLYYTCLLSFIEDTSFDKLGEAIENRDFSYAFEQSHTLKGVSGNLGLTGIFKSVCIIVESLRHNEYDNLQQLFQIVLAEKEKLEQILSTLIVDS